MLITAIAVIVIFTLLVLIHEFGHFYMAKKAGIKVEEFGLGLPPRVGKGFKYKGTIYSLNWIPFGGFVRLYGEDGHTRSILKDRKSFASKTKWQRTKVVLAGVFMNFVLAYVLLVAGFMIGIEPLFVNFDDIVDAVKNGQIDVVDGISITQQPSEGSIASQLGINVGDKILNINGESVNNVSDFSFLTGGEIKEDIALTLLRGEEISEITVPKSDAGFGVKLKMFNLPTFSVVGSSDSNILVGDKIRSVNGQWFSPQDTSSILLNNIEVTREGVSKEITVKGSDVIQKTDTLVFIESVLEESVAEKVGLVEGDYLVYLNGARVFSPLDVQTIIKSDKKSGLVMGIIRDGEPMKLQVAGFKDKYFGVLMRENFVFSNGLIVRNELDLYTIKNIEKIKLGFVDSMTESLSEMSRISFYTAKMFMNVLGQFVTSFDVPDGVAGPVGIVKLTGVFVQEGMASLLRFTALLSLSLGVINLLPIPALDGGRFMFIIIEAIIGRRIDAKLEAKIHGFGFLFLMLLITAVTISDIKAFF